MVSFDGFSLTDGIPIYQQILLFLKREAVAGTIRDGDELPSRRVLSALLGVNPNTIQKAYRMLEEEGLIASHSGAKSLMVLNEETLRRVRGELLEADAKGVVNAMKQMGLTKEEALVLIDQYWE
ncbi:GntR family transcriptional regulator [Anaeromassilibacillus sp. An200]|uniref:GntR family transcriptional regulator n=1 Tax=Anaeromassilibacillus sp. An200 TaxID=1965587 RepID=UPI000B3A7107|nr:GntR family transcriptional regulator [Anaeromassilibacillus sp. An200]OUP08722.1 GntR family transcriptional regulator [Anaeromassilibacillus sp. An200]